MNRVLLLSALIILSLYGCENEKEKDGLAKFVVGDWESQELTLETMSEGQSSPVGHFTISIKDDDTYILEFEGFDCGADTYTISGDRICLKKLIIDPLYDNTPIPAAFTVTWIPGETQMTWSEFSNLPELIWTKL